MPATSGREKTELRRKKDPTGVDGRFVRGPRGGQLQWGEVEGNRGRWEGEKRGLPIKGVPQPAAKREERLGGLLYRWKKEKRTTADGGQRGRKKVDLRVALVNRSLQRGGSISLVIELPKAERRKQAE